MKSVLEPPQCDRSICEPGECKHLPEMIHQFADSLGRAIDAKDSLTHFHSQQVAVISLHIAVALGLSHDEAEAVHVAGHLHDLGKIGVPETVLRKKGPLSGEEWSWIKKHPEIGAGILKPVKKLSDIFISGIAPS